MEIQSIEPVYYALDKDTGVALIRAEDRPPRSGLVDFMRGSGVVKPGSIVPVCWEQIWDYRGRQGEVPSLFRWPQFVEWLDEWPGELDAFKQMWKQHFGMPEHDLADAAVVIWEEKRYG
ncbi:hypothetical protein IIA79_07375 [bacterium]|nr:hypothetical protein [bacterium]